MMGRWQRSLPLLCLTAVAAMNILGDTAEVVEGVTLEVKNLTNSSVKVIPHSGNSSSVTKLVVEGSLVTLNEEDRQALASYSALVELHLVGNQVTAVPAKYFSVVPHLGVLSLSRNNINCLDAEAFFGLDVLTELDLSHNQLTSLPTQLLTGLNNLQVLNLEGNPWNCSCALLTSIGEAIAANISIGGAAVTCASPETMARRGLLEATAACYPSPTTVFTTDSEKIQTSVNSRQSFSSSTVKKTTLSAVQHQTINTDRTPVLGNIWKFIACVAGLALTTSTLIACGIKGPSWYKLFHNYQHRRLDQEEDEEGDVSTVFSGRERHVNHQTFTFEQRDGETEVEEDEYFEDPYIKREESNEEEGI